MFVHELMTRETATVTGVAANTVPGGVALEVSES